MSRLILQQLSLCVVAVTQLTSSQPTVDVSNDVNSCGRTDQTLNQLVTAVSRLETAVSQLQKDLAQVKAATMPNYITGELTSELKAKQQRKLKRFKPKLHLLRFVMTLVYNNSCNILT